jgi:hypothetical protein
VDGRINIYAAMALMKRSPKMTANWALAMVHSRGGIVHSFSDLCKIRYSNLVAAFAVLSENALPIPSDL